MITQYPLPRPVPSGVVDIHEQIQRASNCDCTPTRVDDARAAKSGRGDDGWARGHRSRRDRAVSARRVVVGC